MVNLPPTRPHAPEGPTGRSTRQIASSQASPSTGAVPERSRVPHLTNHVATQVPPSGPPSQGPSCEAETLLDSKLKLYGVVLHTVSQKIAERIQSYVRYIMCDVYHLKGTIDIRIQVGGLDATAAESLLSVSFPRQNQHPRGVDADTTTLHS